MKISFLIYMNRMSPISRGFKNMLVFSSVRAAPRRDVNQHRPDDPIISSSHHVPISQRRQPCHDLAPGAFGQPGLSGTAMVMVEAAVACAPRAAFRRGTAASGPTGRRFRPQINFPACCGRRCIHAWHGSARIHEWRSTGQRFETRATIAASSSPVSLMACSTAIVCFLSIPLR